MKLLRGLPIQRKLTLVLALNAAIALAIGTTGFSVYESIHARRDAERELSTAAAMIGANSAAPLIFQDVRSAEGTLAALAAESRIVAARLYTADGGVFADYAAAAAKDLVLPESPPAMQGAFEDGSRLTLFREIGLDGERVGGILLLADMSDVTQRMQWFALFALCGMVAALLAALQISSRLQQVVSGPILALAGVAREIRDNRNYAIRAKAVDKDEIGELVEAFNEMVEQVENRDQLLEDQVRERTEQLTLERDRAEEAARLKSEFLANMSHEIRTPMNVIIGMTELTLDGELEDRQRKHLRMVQRSAESLLTIINDVLDFSKVEAGKLELEPIEFDLIEMVTETAQSFTVRAADRSLDLQCAIGGDTPQRVVGDSARLRQVLINLIGNAIKFTSEGEVRVSTAVTGSDESGVEIEFVVSDTGIGIPEEKQRLIFEAFAQADGSMTRRFGGTGLGLAISSRLVNLMGGEIEVESRPGEGSRFSFRVRLGAVAERRAVAAPGFEDIRCVIVDPKPESRKALAQALASWQIQSACLDNMDSAYEVMRWAASIGRPFSVFVADFASLAAHACPVETMEADGAMPVLPLVILTGPHDKPACPPGAKVELVLKPFARSELFGAIAKLLDLPGLPEIDAAEQEPAAGWRFYLRRICRPIRRWPWRCSSGKATACEWPAMADMRSRSGRNRSRT
jgi:signal transduction histidine kinase